MSQRRVDICNKLPADHPFQPLVIEPLNIIPADTPLQKPTRLTPLQRAQPSAAAEDPKEQPSSDLLHFGSPSNLFSLEKHLGGIP